MAVCMATSLSQSYTFEENDVFESRVIESNGSEKMLASNNDVTSAITASRSIMRPMSAPSIGNTSFQFGVPGSSVEILAGDCVHMPSKKTRAKSFPVIQPTCLFLEKYQEQLAKKRSCLKRNTFSKLKLKLQRSLRDPNNEDLPFCTLALEEHPTQCHLGSGVYSVSELCVDMPLQFYGPRINAQPSPIIVQGNSPERERSPGRICRICHEGAGTLISPCLCSGTVALIHKNCLERWLTQTSSSSCEICRYPFRVERRPLPFYKVFSDSTNAKLRRSIIIDLACFVGLTPLAFSAICLCLLSAMQNMTSEVGGTIDPLVAKAQEENIQWESGCLIFLALMLLLSYIVWLSCTSNTHMKTWASWRQASLQVKLLDVKRPCLDLIGISTAIPLAPLRLMSDESTITSSDQSNAQHIHNASSPMSAQLRGASLLSGAPYVEPAQSVPGTSGTTPVKGDPCDGPAQDVPGISRTPVNGTERPLSDAVEEADAVRN